LKYLNILRQLPWKKVQLIMEMDFWSQNEEEANEERDY
jgi:hypothetical protein